jgi:PPM family protein phosphatase
VEPRATPLKPLVLLQSQLDASVPCETASASVVAFSTPAPYPGRRNEDGVAVLDLLERGTIAVVADGAGGQPAGDRAAELAVNALVQCIEAVNDVRDGVLSGFERANQAVLELGVGAATTLAVAHLTPQGLRTYHAGDSAVMVFGQRGKLKLQTIAHSPVGYAIEAGVLDAFDAMDHTDRHLVSNLIGTHEMRIEVGPLRALGHFDTVVVASDGLFDNLGVDEVGALVRKGPLATAAHELATAARQRMAQEDKPSKPDDLSFVVMRHRSKS